MFIIKVFIHFVFGGKYICIYCYLRQLSHVVGCISFITCLVTVVVFGRVFSYIRGILSK